MKLMPKSYGFLDKEIGITDSIAHAFGLIVKKKKEGIIFENLENSLLITVEDNNLKLELSKKKWEKVEQIIINI